MTREEVIQGVLKQLVDEWANLIMERVVMGVVIIEVDCVSC